MLDASESTAVLRKLSEKDIVSKSKRRTETKSKLQTLLLLLALAGIKIVLVIVSSSDLKQVIILKKGRFD